MSIRGRLLGEAHLQTVTDSSAEAFLTDTNRPKFSCLVLDIQLKGMSGLDLGRKLHAIKDSTPIVFNTSQDSPELRAQAEALDGAVCFRKTNAGAEILAAIRRIIQLQETGSG